eukprot:TRINITY_DN18315_c0_g1_i1.p1 TRINITY_DN18315_c0_g1~~TRINITY_DN18315_c0_g1_i1.p1  ORF type:complete len:408 (+),score=132.22 TRINITY_DN18315_c0_g1_i1:70-1224(+)
MQPPPQRAPGPLAHPPQGRQRRRVCGGGRRRRAAGAARLLSAALVVPLLAPAASKEYNYAGQDDKLFCFNAAMRNLVWPPPKDNLLAVDAEADLWFRMQAWIQSRAVSDDGSGSARGPYLDIGCGMGRIMVKFGRLFGSAPVHCIEPDGSRIAAAQRLLQSEGWEGNNVTFSQQTFSEWKPPPGTPPFQVISSVHVVQHISRQELQRWINRIAGLLAPDGVVIIATKRAPREIFEAQPFGPGTFGGSHSVTPEEFDDIAWNGASRTPPVLAVRSFSRWSLRAALAKGTGLRAVDAGDFSFMGEPPVLRPDSQFIVLAKEHLRGARPQPVTEPHVLGMQVEELRAKRAILLDAEELCRRCHQCEKLKGYPVLPDTTALGDSDGDD